MQYGGIVHLELNTDIIKYMMQNRDLRVKLNGYYKPDTMVDFIRDEVIYLSKQTKKYDLDKLIYYYDDEATYEIATYINDYYIRHNILNIPYDNKIICGRPYNTMISNQKLIEKSLVNFPDIFDIQFCIIYFEKVLNKDIKLFNKKILINMINKGKNANLLNKYHKSIYLKLLQSFSIEDDEFKFCRFKDDKGVQCKYLCIFNTRLESHVCDYHYTLYK